MPLAYAAVGPSRVRKKRRAEQTKRMEKIGKMRKSLPFKRRRRKKEKPRKQGNQVGALSSDGGGLTAH